MLKTCSKCKTSKPLDDFHAQRGGRFGKRADCKECNKSRVAKYAAENREKVLARKAKHRANNKEKYKKWNDARDKEALRKSYQKYRLANRHKRAKTQAKRRAVKSNATPSWYGELDEFVLQEAYNLASERKVITGYEWQVDHMVPLQAEIVCGLHVWNNFQVIPAALNRIKRNRLIFIKPFEWLRYGIK